MRFNFKVIILFLAFLPIFFFLVKNAYAQYSPDYYETQCFVGTSASPCDWPYFTNNCTVASNFTCLLSPSCSNQKSGNTCKAQIGYQDCQNTNIQHNPDGSVFGTYNMCPDGGWPGFQFYNPPPTPTPTPNPAPGGVCDTSFDCPGCRDCIANNCIDSNLFCSANEACINAACVTNPTPTPTTITPTPTPTPTVTPGPCPYEACVPGTNQCSGTGKQTCESTANGWCWSAPFCGAGTSCDPATHQCVPPIGGGSSCPTGSPSCTSQQSNQNKTACYDGTSYQTCSQLPGSNPPIYCYQNLASCPAGETCNVNSGNCQPGNPPTVPPPSATPPPTFPPGCFIFNGCDASSGGSSYTTVLIWPISLVQQGYCGLGEECITTAGSGTSCTNHSCIYRGPAVITGSVFTDYNSNRIKDAGETDYSGEYTINVTSANGPYRPNNCPSSDYYACMAAMGYQGSAVSFCQDCAKYPANPASSGSPQCNGGNYSSCVSTCTSSPSSCPGVGSGWSPAQYCNAQCTQGAQCCGGSYGVCSSWWCGFKATCGTDCTGTFTPVPPAPPTSTNKSGAVYTTSGSGGGSLAYGTYTVSLSIPGATLTEPTSGNSFTVVAGTQKFCSTGGSSNASCYLGGIRNLHFGIKGNNPWYQTIGGDIRRDSGVSVQIPANASCGAYASLPGSGGSPGIIYSGSSSTSFGSGQASATNWIAGGVTYPETYSPTRPNLIRTSYNYLASVAKAAAITPIDISTYCSGGLNACTLPTNLPNGLYIANDNLTITGSGYTFPANKNFVILVNGNLTIKEQIHVPGGSTATFSASGDITIDKSVGQSSSSSTAADVEGFFSADKNFIIDGNNNCAIAPDTRVNVAGAVVVNAALAGGTLQNNRNLCTGNDNCPAFSVAERADFVLNAPEFIKHPSYTYQESAP